MRGSIVGPLTSNPKGLFLEGIIDDTSKPGTCMEITPGSSPVGGRHHYRHYQPSADADPRAVIVLLEDDSQGGIFSKAYVAGTRCRMYVPLAGEEINVLFAGQAGTASADDTTIGERLVIDNATGMLIKESTSSVSAPFTSMEAFTGVPHTPALVWCMTN